MGLEAVHLPQALGAAPGDLILSPPPHSASSKKRLKG